MQTWVGGGRGSNLGGQQAGRHSGVNINVETTKSEVLEIIDFVIGERNRLEFDL